MSAVLRPYTLAPMPLAPPKLPPYVPILRPGTCGACEAIVLSDQPLPVGCHYFPESTLKTKPTTLPHITPVCECYGCVCKVKVRYRAYLAGFWPDVSRQCLMELTAGAADQLARDFSLERRSWRGLTLRLVRQGKSYCGPVRAFILPRREDDKNLPLACDVEGALRRIWGEMPIIPRQPLQ